MSRLACCLTLMFLVAAARQLPAQHLLSGRVVDEQQMPLKGATLLFPDAGLSTLTDSEGRWEVSSAEENPLFRVSAAGFRSWEGRYTGPDMQIQLEAAGYELAAVELEGTGRSLGLRSMGEVEGMGIYAGKKTEVVLLEDVLGNKGANQARQMFVKVAGIHVWESDGAGLQLGIGGRGLSPNRSANFNTRQNGYDMAADALGYPESYYSPPMQALQRIEVVRGAASLQFGPQFGGMVNFVFRDPDPGHKLLWEGQATAGAFGFLGSYQRLSGTSGKWSYQALHQLRTGAGWRPNSEFDSHTAFGQLRYQPRPGRSLRLEYTLMRYLARQPGGLTDAQFAQNPRQSIRERNWFRVRWNLLAAQWDEELSERSRLQLRVFGNASSREALGLLERITVADFGQTRNLISDEYLNGGAEFRWLNQFNIGQRRSDLLIGARLYRGHTTQRQGDGLPGAGPDFTFASDGLLEGAEYEFPNANLALFAEQVFRLGDRWIVTPGLRWEHIRTFSEGYFRQRVFDFAGNVVSDQIVEEEKERIRSFLLMGLGLSFQANKWLECYANVSENYRAVTFSDLRIVNPNFQIDPDIQDESGFTLDTGLRGQRGNLFRYDISLYYLRYNDRIGLLLRADQPPLYLDYRLRTNIADSYTLGAEAVVEADVLRLIKGPTFPLGWVLFSNIALNQARYVNTSDLSILGKEVEFVPKVMWRGGMSWHVGNWEAQWQMSHVSQQFTDATNALRSSSAVNGLIPAYQVADVSIRYKWRSWSLDAGVTNVFNQMYFTRRAVSYPGPGIIPGEGRGWFVTVGWHVGKVAKR